LAIGVVHILAALVGGAIGWREKQERSEAEFICRWPATAPGRASFRSLAAKPNASVQYREIIARSNADELTIEAAEALAQSSSERSDLSLLGQLHGRFAANQVFIQRLQAAQSALQRRLAGV
jgi:hypothetical protein